MYTVEKYGKSNIVARIVADSVSSECCNARRITTFELEYPRFIHCFSADTEVLSQISEEPPEFRDFSAVSALGAKVAQYLPTTNGIEFVLPSANIHNRGNHRMVTFNKGKLPMMVTDKHRVFTLKRTTGGEFKPDTILAEELLSNFGTRRIPQSGFYNQQQVLTDAEIELAAWFAADGNSPDVGNSVNFHLRKQRKVDEIVRILSECNIPYELSNYGDEFVIRFQKTPLTDGSYTGNGEKCIYPQALCMSQAAYEKFKRALLLSDGSMTNQDYNTSSETLINQIQVTAHLHGDSLNIHQYGSLYKCTFKRNPYISLRQDKDSFEITDYRGDVYCVTVPSSYVVVRRKGVVFISGNCELMTHRLFSRNAASSRAIPVTKMLKMVRNAPATPVRFGLNKGGMQDTGVNAEVLVMSPLDGGAHSPDVAWGMAAVGASCYAEQFSKAGYHKQIANRLIEPFQMMKTVVTATEWNNFFWLRIDEAADPTIQELARVMKEAMDVSMPEILEPGQWHTPYVDHVRECDPYDTPYNKFCGYMVCDEDTGAISMLTLQEALAVSASCCAQVSYRNLNTNCEKAMEIYNRLISGSKVHASPFEHQATPMRTTVEEYGDHWEDNELLNVGHDPSTWEKGITHMDRDFNFWSGNFCGWIQHRQLLDNNVVKG